MFTIERRSPHKPEWRKSPFFEPVRQAETAAELALYFIRHARCGNEYRIVVVN